MNPYLQNVLPFTPAILRRLIAALPADRLDVPTDTGRFSVREVVAHLADWEPILLERMKSSLENSGSSLQGRDEVKMAAANGYTESDINVQLENFERSRAQTVAFLNGLSGHDWDRFGIHSERGRQSVYDQANLLLGHDLYHIEQVSAML